MKNRIIFTTAILSMGLLLATGGCAKLKGSLFQAFTTGSTSVDFDIPVINDTTAQADWGTVVFKQMNIDSIIKEESKGVFSLKDVKKVSISEMKMTLKNSDVSNNFANFEKGIANFNTNTNPTVIVVNTGLNPDIYSSSWILPSISGVNLKDYVNSTAFNYILSCQARRKTTKILNATLAIKFHLE